MNSLLPTFIEEFTQKIEGFSGRVVREENFPDVPDKIMVAIGMRRTGKTYFLFQTIRALLKNVPLSHILYINFEDDRLFPSTQKKLKFILLDHLQSY